MRVVVDYDLCDPNAICMGILPRCSKRAMTTSSTSSTIIPARSTGRSSSELRAGRCPMQAISVEEE